MVTLAQGWNAGQHQGCRMLPESCPAHPAESTLYAMRRRKVTVAACECHLEWTPSKEIGKPRELSCRLSRWMQLGSTLESAHRASCKPLLMFVLDAVGWLGDGP